MPDSNPDLGPGGHLSYRLLRFVLRDLVSRFVEDLGNPKAATERQLSALLAGGRDAAFLRDHKASKIQTLSDYRDAVPVRTHAELKPWLDRVAMGESSVLVSEPTDMLLETSGTTGQPKHLPVTRTWAEHVQQAQRLWTLAMVRDHPALSGGGALTMVSPAVHALSPGGIPIGSNTGRIRAAQPAWLRRRFVVPDEVMEISDPIARQYAVLRFGLGADVRSITTANPSLLLLLFRRLQEWREPLSADLHDGTLRHGAAVGLEPDLRQKLERRLRRESPPSDWSPTTIWNLSTVNCWTGGPAEYFAQRLQAQLGTVPVREVGISASEGSFAFPLGHSSRGSVLWTGGHVMEFIDSEGRLHWPWELDEGDRVRLVVSTAAGLFRYDMEDELEVVGHCLETPLVRFVGKSGRYLNTVGERVTEGQVSSAMAAVDGELVGFTVHPELGDIPSYVIAFEGKVCSSSLVEQFDQALQSINVEYAGKRVSGRLGLPRILHLESGHYARYRLRRMSEGAPEGQLKDPILALDDVEWTAVVGKEQN